MPKGLVTLNFSNLELITLHPSRTAMPEEDNHENFVEDTDEVKLCQESKPFRSDPALAAVGGVFGTVSVPVSIMCT